MSNQNNKKFVDNPDLARSLNSLPAGVTAGSDNRAFDNEAADGQRFKHNSYARKNKHFDEDNEDAETISDDENASSYDVPLDQQDSRKQTNDRKTWDAFAEEKLEKVSSLDEHFWERIYIAAKILFTLILFVLVLGSALISKGALFFIIANVMPPNSMWNSSLKTAKYHFRYEHTETDVTWIWSLMLIVITPYILTVLVSIWKILLKKMEPIPNKTVVLWVLIIETLHSVGLCVFAFVLLPNVDPITGAVICMNVVALPSCLSCIFPGVIHMKKRSVPTNDFEESSKPSRTSICKIMMFAIISVLASISSIVFWCYYVAKLNSETGKESTVFMIGVTCSPLLVSVIWWKTFVPQGNGKGESRWLPKLKYQIRECGPKVSAIIFSWKIIITVGITIALYSVDCEDSSSCLQTLFMSAGNTKNAAVLSTTFGRTNLVEDTDMGLCSRYLPLYIALVNIAGSILCHRSCAVACKILAQIQAFSIPLVFVTPLFVACMFVVMVISKYEILVSNGCYLPLPYWFGDVEFDWTMIVAGISGYVSVIMVTSHIWEPRKERNQKTDRIFTQPFYCGLLLDQSMLLNRTKHAEDHGFDKTQRQRDGAETIDSSQMGGTPFIYMCATMWHETEQEMKQLLMSIMRVDQDQCYRRIYMGSENDPDFYEFEAHIFFDDAYVYTNGECRFNTYVNTLIDTINKAKRTIHTHAVEDIPPPILVETPYGARLTWTLPGKNVLIAHLKNKNKIRHKKRWSQIMYIYYFLAYKLIVNESVRAEDKQERAKHVFLLALDGDVDFHPSALRLLVDKMKKNPNVGAACGRIHPIGTGPMVWYQKFEYAVSHWLQKATEHVTGCVLCSPGCFSLFRGSALMDKNVSKRYTTPPSEARHHVQYDQGEDRWLCTLLLQRGWRVEYCAASDALTFAPEGFNEFYNQRRRWTPSTMANVMDLLMDWKNVRKINNDISLLFIAYQFLLMISSILTPGTIFLMIVGAINMAYPTLSLTLTLVVNIVPVAVFILLCYVAKQKIQLAFAAILSTAYSLLMMLVIVGLLRQVIDYGLCSVTTVFLCFIGGVFVVSAFLHPQEFWCIAHGFLYFLAIPSMSMLLMVYSLCNLHDVSWGTRETPATAAATPASKSKEKTNEPQNIKTSVQEWMSKIGGSSDYTFSFGNLFRCICCPNKTTADENITFHEGIMQRFDQFEARLNTIANNKTTTEDGVGEHPVGNTGTVHVAQKSDQYEEPNDKTNQVRREETDTNTPPWKVDDYSLDENERLFWEELIKTYLLPFESDAEKEKKMKDSLIRLRNKVCLFFILINALFVTIVFSLQQVNADSGGTISIKLSCSGSGYGEAIEPISIAFTLVFGILLLIQFICMLFHRMSTFLHVCSSIGWTPTTHVNFYEIIKKMQETTPTDDDTISTVSSEGTISEEISKGDIHRMRSRDLRRTLNPHKRHGRQLEEIMQTHLCGMAQTLKKAIKLDANESNEGGIDVRDNKPGHAGDRNRFFKRNENLVKTIKRDKRFAQTIIQRGDDVSKTWIDVARNAKSMRMTSANGISEDKPKVGFKLEVEVNTIHAIPKEVHAKEMDSKL